MPRRHRTRYESPQQARFLTFSCYRRLALFQNDKIKTAFAEHLLECELELRFRLLEWVVMPEHVHLLLVPRLPEMPVPTILRRVKEPFARRALARWRTLRAPILERLVDSRGNTRFWQRGGGYDRNILTDDELFEKTRYIHENPVRRGLVDDVRDWRWSSVGWVSCGESGRPR
ncbi:MAG: transposase [Phycisphaerales bacterium JB054]